MSSAILINVSKEQDKWSGMVILSIAVHLAVFLTFFLVPEDPPLGLSDKEVVYEVDLVDISEADLNTRAEGKQVIDSSSNNIETKRIFAPKQENTLVVAKRTVTKKSLKPKKKELTSGQLLDKAISRIKTKTSNENSNYLDKAISDLDKKTATYQPGSTGTIGGVADRFYKMQVETWIKNNWAYPVARGDSDKLEAVIVIKVNQDGTILDIRFVKRSKDNLFDKSVLQAIEKSKKVPPLPKGFNKSYEEIEINFNLKDLK